MWARFGAGLGWFQTGEHTRKAKNVARDPALHDRVATKGFDVMVSGEARRVIDPAIVAEDRGVVGEERMAHAAEQLGSRNRRTVQCADARTAAVVQFRNDEARARDRSRYRRRDAGFDALAVLEIRTIAPIWARR